MQPYDYKNLSDRELLILIADKIVENSNKLTDHDKRITWLTVRYWLLAGILIGCSAVGGGYLSQLL